MNKITRVAEISPEYTSIWECPNFVADGFRTLKSVRGNRVTFEEYAKFLNKTYLCKLTKLINRIPSENSPKKTGLNADIIYSEEIL